MIRPYRDVETSTLRATMDLYSRTWMRRLWHRRELDGIEAELFWRSLDEIAEELGGHLVPEIEGAQ